jgi:hypothetical protein
MEVYTVFTWWQGMKLIKVPRKPARGRELSTACSDWTNIAFPINVYGRGKMLFLKMAG